MRRFIRPTRLLAPTLLLTLTGCFKLSREAPVLQQYVLSGASPASTVPAAATGSVNAGARNRAGLTIGLRRLNLASYLAVPAIVLRRGDNRIVTSEFHRWGEELESGMNRAVASHLAGVPPVQAVEVAPWPARVNHDFIVQLHVSRFEGVVDSAATEGRVHLQAGWDIIRPLNGAVLLRGSTDERGGSWRAGDYAGLVKGLDMALARLARDISACLARFPNDSTPPASCGPAAGPAGVQR
ncbi:MAG: PqiC family protein [Gemmatimonadota bacterium]